MLITEKKPKCKYNYNHKQCNQALSIEKSFFEHTQRYVIKTNKRENSNWKGLLFHKNLNSTFIL